MSPSIIEDTQFILSFSGRREGGSSFQQFKNTMECGTQSLQVVWLASRSVQATLRYSWCSPVLATSIIRFKICPSLLASVKMLVPDQRTGPAGVWQVKGKHKRFATLAHRQDHPSVFLAHRLSRP